MAALAAEMKLAQTEVYEVATFYAHFDVVKEGETPPPPVTVRVCELAFLRDGGRRAPAQAICRRRSAPSVRVRARALHGRVRSRAGLRGRPRAGDAGDRRRGRRSRRDADTHAHALKPGTDFDALHGRRRLPAARRSVSTGKRTRDDLIKIVSDAGLRGLGGAGFPTGRKWQFVRAEQGPRLMAVNADEGEPGTFKDRYYLGLDPHRFLEGMLIAAWVVEAAEVYIYIRDEYPELRLMLVDEIAKLEARGPRPATPRSICAAAPAPTSAAKSRR